MKKLLDQEHEKRKAAREAFHLTDVAITQTICKEVRKAAVAEEVDEGN